MGSPVGDTQRATSAGATVATAAAGAPATARNRELAAANTRRTRKQGARRAVMRAAWRWESRFERCERDLWTARGCEYRGVSGDRVHFVAVRARPEPTSRARIRRWPDPPLGASSSESVRRRAPGAGTNRYPRGTEMRGIHAGAGRSTAMAVVTMRQLLESGVHFGHQTRRWNPKMKRFIFTERNGIYIIDLQQSLSFIDRAFEFVRETVAHGGTLLFVGTKRQAQEADLRAGHPRRHAVRQPALAGRHAHQLPDRPQAPPAAQGARGARPR